MTIELNGNLSQIFRQQQSKLTLDHPHQDGQAPVLKPFSLRTSVSPFVVDHAFALQLDEII
jgi:hypothetical protein